MPARRKASSVSLGCYEPWPTAFQRVEGSHSSSVAGAHQTGILMNLTDTVDIFSSSFLRHTTCLDYKHISWQEVSYNA